MKMVTRRTTLANAISEGMARVVRVAWTAEEAFELRVVMLQIDRRRVVQFYTGGHYHKPRLGSLRAHARWGRFKASGSFPPIRSAGGKLEVFAHGCPGQGYSWKRTKRSPQAWPRHNQDGISAMIAAYACETHAYWNPTPTFLRQDESIAGSTSGERFLPQDARCRYQKICSHSVLPFIC